MAATDAAAADRPPAPYVEDYHSDDSEVDSVKVDNFSNRPPTSQANIATKRSLPSDLGADKSTVSEKVFSDRQSDSGYSSHTAATMGSADSDPSAHPQSPPVAVVDPDLPPPPSPPQRRPPLGEERKRSSQTSPVKPLQRASSVSSRNRPPRERRSTASSQPCTDPNCDKCEPTQRPSRGRRPGPSPLESSPAVSYAQSTSSDPMPSSYTSPNSPTYNRQQAQYMHGSTVVQPAATNTRRRSSSTARARPQSYHGDPGQGYAYNAQVVPAPYPSPPQEHHSHGPPPAMSAHYAMQHANHHHQAMGHYPPNPMYAGTPANGYYPPQMQTSPPYEQPRPSMMRSNGSYNARGSMYGGQPRPSQDTNLPSARHPPQPQGGARQEYYPQKQLKYNKYEEESSSSEYDSEEEEEEPQPQKRSSRALMAPPKLKPTPTQTRQSSPQRRPSLHRRPATTTQVYQAERRMSVSQPQVLVERTRDRDPRSSRVSTAAQSRAQSKTRPAMQPKSQSWDTRGTHEDPVIVVDPRPGRRPSAQAETVADRRRSVYGQDDLARAAKMYKAEERRRPKEYHPEDRRRQTVYYPTEKQRQKVTNVENKRQSQIYFEESDSSDESDDLNEPPQRRRRETVYEERPAQRRAAKEEVYVEEAQPLRRRKTVTEQDGRGANPRQAMKMQDAINDTEEYLRKARGNDVPYSEHVHRAAKRSSRVPSGPSDAGSSRSKNSDGKSRISQSNRTTVTNGGNGDIRLRVDATAPISLQFNGDMEGRTLQINPAEGGMADIVIGNPRGEESTYRSERGSIYGGSKKAITGPDQARREAEAQSVKSSRTSHSRRESERKPLRRVRREIEVDDYDH